jgi:uncharacterized protein YerC
MRKTTDPKVAAVLNMWLGGMSYRDIEARLGVSIATISDIVTDFCQQYPLIAALRELNLETKRTGISVSSASEAISFLEQLKASGLSVYDVSRCIKFLNHYAPRQKEALEAGIRVWNLEHETGQTYGAILSAATTAISEKEKALRMKQELQAEINKYSNMLPDYEKLSSLKTKLTNHQITMQELDGYIDYNLSLKKLKFDYATAEYLASALASIGLTPQEASQELARQLMQGKTLLQSIAYYQEQEREAASFYNRKLAEYSQSYNGQVGYMQNVIAALNTNIEARKGELRTKDKELTAVKDKINEMNRVYNTEKDQLEAEKKGIEGEIAAKRSELSSLQENLRKTKEELAGIDSLIHKNEKLALIASFLEKPDLPLEKEAMLELTQLIIETLKLRYADYHPEFRRGMIKADLDRLGRNIKEELKFERAFHAG